MMKKSVELKNIHITLTYFLNESRIIKEINSLLESGIVSKVVVIAIWKSGLKRSEEIGDNIKIIRVNIYLIYVLRRLFGINEILFNKFVNILLSFYVLLQNPNIVNIHHVNSLGVVRLKKVLRNCLFIYDTHELETETQSSVGKMKIYRQKLEQNFIPLVDHTFVVTPSIENWYRKTYSIDRINTIMNTPLKHGEMVKSDMLRKKFKIDNKHTIFIYNGSLFAGRGIEIMLEVFERIPDKTNHIIFMGDGDLEGLIMEFEKRNNNIHFQQAVHPSKVIEYTTSADVGISLIENVCLSYYYCLPNKIFEYTIAEIPMIVSNMFDMAKYVLDNNIGIVVESFTVEDITKSIEEMAQDKDKYGDALVKAKENFNWENEGKKMIRVYKELLASD